MTTCKCNDCKQCASERKIAQFEEPNAENKWLNPRNKNKPASKKVLLDRMKQCEKEMWYYLDSIHSGHSGAWMLNWHKSSFKSASLRYEELKKQFRALEQ
jgi:hypothetical protein